MTPIPTDVSWSLFLATIAGGGIGGLLRYMTGVMVRRFGRAAPTGTLIVNLAGAVLAGLVTWMWSTGLIGAESWFVLNSGLLGALTTYSTWMLEVAALLRSGRKRRALGYLAGTMAAGLVLASCGIILSLH